MAVSQQHMAVGSRGGESERIYGLDVLRALAVLFVMVTHTLTHGTPPQWLKWYFWPQGLTGVEIFYVLSGFLIGSILIRSSIVGRLNTFGDVLDFWKRRWARTVPLYAFFLLVFLRFDYHGPADLRQVWQFFLFMQNLAWPMTPFFEHSWSLAVEEWFYLFAPCIYLIASSVLRSKRRAAYISCVMFLAIPLAARIILGRHAQSPIDVDRFVRSIVICRLDSIFIGVALAYLRINHRRWFEGMAEAWHLPLAIFLCFTVYISWGVPGISGRPLVNAAFFPAFSMSIAALVPAAMSLRTLGNDLLDRFVIWTSKISYSLYLGHICVLTLVLGILSDHGWQFAGLKVTLMIYAILFVGYYLFAQVTYLLVEQPYIKLRDRVMGHSDERSGTIAVH